MIEIETDSLSLAHFNLLVGLVELEFVRARPEQQSPVAHAASTGEMATLERVNLSPRPQIESRRDQRDVANNDGPMSLVRVYKTTLGDFHAYWKFEPPASTRKLGHGIRQSCCHGAFYTFRPTGLDKRFCLKSTNSFGSISRTLRVSPVISTLAMQAIFYQDVARTEWRPYRDADVLSTLRRRFSEGFLSPCSADPFGATLLHVWLPLLPEITSTNVSRLLPIKACSRPADSLFRSVLILLRWTTREGAEKAGTMYECYVLTPLRVRTPFQMLWNPTPEIEDYLESSTAVDLTRLLLPEPNIDFGFVDSNNITQDFGFWLMHPAALLYLLRQADELTHVYGQQHDDEDRQSNTFYAYPTTLYNFAVRSYMFWSRFATPRWDHADRLQAAKSCLLLVTRRSRVLHDHYGSTVDILFAFDDDELDSERRADLFLQVQEEAGVDIRQWLRVEEQIRSTVFIEEPTYSRCYNRQLDAHLPRRLFFTYAEGERPAIRWSWHVPDSLPTTELLEEFTYLATSPVAYLEYSTRTKSQCYFSKSHKAYWPPDEGDLDWRHLRKRERRLFGGNLLRVAFPDSLETWDSGGMTFSFKFQSLDITFNSLDLLDDSHWERQRQRRLRKVGRKYNVKLSIPRSYKLPLYPNGLQFATTLILFSLDVAIFGTRHETCLLLYIVSAVCLGAMLSISYIIASTILFVRKEIRQACEELQWLTPTCQQKEAKCEQLAGTAFNNGRHESKA